MTAREEPTIGDLARAQHRFIRPLRLSERCSRCWMGDHCRREQCPCECPTETGETP